MSEFNQVGWHYCWGVANNRGRGYFGGVAHSSRVTVVVESGKDRGGTPGRLVEKDSGRMLECRGVGKNRGWGYFAGNGHWRRNTVGVTI